MQEVARNMSDPGTVGLILFFVLLIALTVGVSRFVKKAWLVSLIATLGSAFAIQFIAFVHQGYFDPFYQIAFVVSLGIGFPVALVVALIVKRTRRKAEGAGTDGVDS